MASMPCPSRLITSPSRPSRPHHAHHVPSSISTTRPFRGIQLKGGGSGAGTLPPSGPAASSPAACPAGRLPRPCHVLSHAMVGTAACPAGRLPPPNPLCTLGPAVSGSQPPLSPAGGYSAGGGPGGGGTARTPRVCLGTLPACRSLPPLPPPSLSLLLSSSPLPSTPFVWRRLVKLGRRPRGMA